MLRRELELFDRELAAKPQLVAANKIDAVIDEEPIAPLAARAAELGLPLFRISAVTGEGVPALLEEAWRHVARAVAAREERTAGPAASGDAPGHGRAAPPPAMLTPDE